MKQFIKNIFKNIDPILSILLLIFLGLSLIILYSAGEQNTNLLIKQLIHFSLGFLIIIIMTNIPMRYIEKIAPFLFLICFFLLILVHFFGTSHGGAKRWLNLYFLQFQPSEILKITLPMMAAWVAKNLYFKIHYQISINLLIITLTCFLILIQPDLGTSLIIGASGIVVIIFSNLSKKKILMSMLGAAASTPILWTFMKDYQKKRVLSFLNPEQDPLGAGYHVIQSKIAIGSGGLFGKGYLKGSQSFLDFLPEAHTDFILGVIGEEFGLIGISILLVLYMITLIRCLNISLNIHDNFQKLLSVSLSIIFFSYAIINISMVSGLLPVVGIPLPLISYGGTSIVTICTSFGILMSINSINKR